MTPFSINLTDTQNVDIHINSLADRMGGSVPLVDGDTSWDIVDAKPTVDGGNVPTVSLTPTADSHGCNAKTQDIPGFVVIRSRTNQGPLEPFEILYQMNITPASVVNADVTIGNPQDN